MKCCRALPLIRVTSRQQPARRAVEETSGCACGLGHGSLSCGRRWLICSHAPVGRPAAPVAVIWPIDHSILLLFRCERRDRSRCCTAVSCLGMAARPNRNLTTDESIEPNDSASLYHTPVSAALDRFVTGNTKWPRSTGTRSSLGVYCIDRAMRTYNAILIWLATSLRNVGPVRQ